MMLEMCPFRLRMTPRLCVQAVDDHRSPRCDEKWPPSWRTAASELRWRTRYQLRAPCAAGAPQGSNLSPVCYGRYSDDIPVIVVKTQAIVIGTCYCYYQSWGCWYRQLIALPRWNTRESPSTAARLTIASYVSIVIAHTSDVCAFQRPVLMSQVTLRQHRLVARPRACCYPLTLDKTSFYYGHGLPCC